MVKIPKAFENCVRGKGRVRTLEGKKFGLAEDQYKHVCYKDGKSFLGEVKTKQKGV